MLAQQDSMRSPFRQPERTILDAALKYYFFQMVILWIIQEEKFSNAVPSDCGAMELWLENHPKSLVCRDSVNVRYAAEWEAGSI